MRARVISSRNSVPIELILAIGGAALVALILLRVLGLSYLDHFTTFPLALGVVVWWPALARWRWRATADVEIADDQLILRSRWRERRIASSSIRAARAVAGRRGASVLLSLTSGATIALGLDRAADAEHLVFHVRDRWGKGDGLTVPVARWTPWMNLLRVATSGLALGYYLHVVRHAIGGDKAFYGLTALLCGVLLLVLHFVRHRGAVALDTAALGDLTAALGDLSAHPPELRRHVRAHASHPPLPAAATAPAHLTDDGEPLDGWLQRLRAQDGEHDHYRGGTASLRADLDDAVANRELSVAERAIALRVVSDGQLAEAQRRIVALHDSLDEESAWLEEVALARDDRAALRLVARRPPRFEPER